MSETEQPAQPLEHGFKALTGLLPEPSMLQNSSGNEWQPIAEEYACNVCRDAGWVRGNLESQGEDRWTSRAIPCPMCRPMPVSEVPSRFKEITFEDFRLSLNPSMKLALEACKEIAAEKRWCLLLAGPPGVGKSMLAAAALKERYGHFWEWGALLRHVRQMCFSDRGPHIPEEDVLAPYQDGKFLLVLDDVGAEKMTEWASQTLYAILNARYQQQLPTIVTTNNMDAIDERVLSRYHEGSVPCVGRDVRKLGGA